jgi:hypothetical protein
MLKSSVTTVWVMHYIDGLLLALGKNVANATEDSGELLRVRFQVPKKVVVSGSFLGCSSATKKGDSGIARYEYGLTKFRGRQAPPKPDAKRVVPDKPPRQIPSLLKMKQEGVTRLVTSRILCMVKKNGLIVETRPLSKCYLNSIKATCKSI